MIENISAKQWWPAVSEAQGVAAENAVVQVYIWTPDSPQSMLLGQVTDYSHFRLAQDWW